MRPALKPSYGLFIGGTTYEGGGQWNPNNVGPLAGESVNVSLLALALYRNTGNVQYLHYAENLTNLVVETMGPASGAGGVSATSVDIFSPVYSLSFKHVL